MRKLSLDTQHRPSLSMLYTKVYYLFFSMPSRVLTGNCFHGAPVRKVRPCIGAQRTERKAQSGGAACSGSLIVFNCQTGSLIFFYFLYESISIPSIFLFSMDSIGGSSFLCPDNTLKGTDERKPPAILLSGYSLTRIPLFGAGKTSNGRRSGMGFSSLYTDTSTRDDTHVLVPLAGWACADCDFKPAMRGKAKV